MIVPRTILLTSLAVIILALSPTSASACGSAAVCSDASSSLTGSIVVDGITISWTTDDESGVFAYRLRRYDCEDPGTCSVTVATIFPAATCGTAYTYDHTDYPPTPLDSWTYTLEVLKVTSGRACAIDVTPQ